MGILGPTIYGCHDSLIKVYFFNNATFRCSMHPHFAKYGKEDEGKYTTYSLISILILSM